MRRMIGWVQTNFMPSAISVRSGRRSSTGAFTSVSLINESVTAEIKKENASAKSKNGAFKKVSNQPTKDGPPTPANWLEVSRAELAAPISSSLKSTGIRDCDATSKKTVAVPMMASSSSNCQYSNRPAKYNVGIAPTQSMRTRSATIMTRRFIQRSTQAPASSANTKKARLSAVPKKPSCCSFTFSRVTAKTGRARPLS